MTLIETSSRSGQIGHTNYHHHLHHIPTSNSTSSTIASSPLLSHRPRDNLNINLSGIQHSGSNYEEHHYSLSLSDPVDIADNGKSLSNVGSANDVKVQVYYCGLILVVYVNDKIKVRLFSLVNLLTFFNYF